VIKLVASGRAMAPKARAGGAKSDVAMAEKENISDGADYRLTQDFGASVALIARSGRLPITREEKIYPTFSTPPTTFSHGPRITIMALFLQHFLEPDAGPFGTANLRAPAKALPAETQNLQRKQGIVKGLRPEKHKSISRESRSDLIRLCDAHSYRRAAKSSAMRSA
jgi:hypothetical protein